MLACPSSAAALPQDAIYWTQIWNDGYTLDDVLIRAPGWGPYTLWQPTSPIADMIGMTITPDNATDFNFA
jgi:hypothetical protein